MTKFHIPGGLLLLSACFLFLLETACDKIEPQVTGPAVSEDAVSLSCEGCHITRKYLRKLAVEVDTGGGGGGG